MKIFAVVVLSFYIACGLVGLSAQEAAKAPVLDASTKELVAALVEAGTAKREVVQAHYTAMLATPEGKSYQDAVAAYNKKAQELNTKVEQKVPGYILDFATGKLIPKPAK